MAVTKQDVDYIAVLARLAFTDAEKEKLTDEMNSVLGYMEKLNSLDTTGIEPLSNMNDRTNVFRPDEIIPSISNSDALRNAPDKQDRFFKVPKVIEQK
ncbi:MAG: Asp-tRNA(Asn)/Glu-tRNA(Gln) amidotransferase subunit GatC [Rhizobacter sp.]|nr:Asp-tRNA(Asn)/Glu-tRNA(Gln) amidotransferase subunit GatC [Chlorobiales bacterium]